MRFLPVLLLNQSINIVLLATDIDNNLILKRMIH